MLKRNFFLKGKLHANRENRAITGLFEQREGICNFFGKWNENFVKKTYSVQTRSAGKYKVDLNTLHVLNWYGGTLCAQNEQRSSFTRHLLRRGHSAPRVSLIAKETLVAVQTHFEFSLENDRTEKTVVIQKKKLSPFKRNTSRANVSRRLLFEPWAKTNIYVILNWKSVSGLIENKYYHQCRIKS